MTRNFVTEFKPFDPIELSKETEKTVIKGNKRKYNLFRLEPFYGQIATARGVGCNLRCGFCWINSSRDNPKNYGKFYSPEEVYEKLIEVSSNEFGRAIMSEKARISGCEPTIGINHLISLIHICEKEGDFKGFLLETNGILLGHDEHYVKSLKRFKNYLHVRLSLKAGTLEAFEKKTGASAKYFHLPFRALEYLRRHEISHHIAVMSRDPKIMPPNERLGLLEKIINREIPFELLEEEKADPFEITLKRLVEIGVINDGENIKELVYEPLVNSLKRLIIMEKPNSDKELMNILNKIYFGIIESACATCTKSNPWHGHAKDDLDNILK